MKAGLIAGTLAIALLLPSPASASNKHARSATEAAVRKFEAVSPSRMKTAVSSCHTEKGWRYWHCKSQVGGTRGYYGTFRSLVNDVTFKAYIRRWQVCWDDDAQCKGKG